MVFVKQGLSQGRQHVEPRRTRVVLAASILALSACSAIGEPGDESVDSLNSDDGAGGGGAFQPTKAGVGGSDDAFILSNTECGNGALDGEEECDDGNEESLDGCNLLCQKSVGFDCPIPGELCVSNVACGDGLQHNTEACDEGVDSDGVGCAADCLSVQLGWQCRVPGRACIPLCGDSLLTAGESCDDGNGLGGDGCSANCLVEPGFDCGETGLGPCVGATCGNSLVEVGEGCDAGEANGLFYGDGSGCSKTCTQEPTCRDEAGTTQACSTACGDANVDPGELCDDGNSVDGDGCSSRCTVEGGFECVHTPNPDTSTDCPDGSSECLILPIIYRDFDATHQDFFALDDGLECVPNASGNKDTKASGNECWASDSTDICQGLAASSLSAQGKPSLGGTDSCECRFTDWDGTGVIGAGSESCYDDGGNERQRIEKTVDVIGSAASFAEWYSDSPSSTKVVSSVVLGEIGGNQFQFSSSDGETVYDDIAGGEGALLESGFFPLEDQSGEGSTKLCNLWPYWDPSLFPGCEGEQWNPDESMGMDYVGQERNFYFTSELRYLFKYAGGESLEFFGDDDVFVYINGQLTLDLGAPHERLRGKVVLADTAATSTVYTADGDESVTNTTMNLAPGSIYEIAIFHADRHPRESNYQLTLQGFSTTSSTCTAKCGDGVATTGEECDDGNLGESPDDGVYNDDATYGGCTTTCSYGPYCGDEIQNGEEECDAGVSNTALYGEEGCTSGCKRPSRCGDGLIDSGFGEQCDTAGASRSCAADCTIITQ